MFLVQDTVEEAIYDISVKRRLAHMQRRHVNDKATEAVEEQSLDAANSLEMQAAPLSTLLTKGYSGGEVVGQEDLWTCLFASRRKKAQSDDVAAAAAGDGVMGEEISRFLRADAAAARAESSAESA